MHESTVCIYTQGHVVVNKYANRRRLQSYFYIMGGTYTEVEARFNAYNNDVFIYF